MNRIYDSNVLLKDFTTFRAGGPATFFIRARNLPALKEGVRLAHQRNLPIFVLGGGSNVLVSDEGFDGVVIKNEMIGSMYAGVNESIASLSLGAGVVWDSAVEDAVQKKLGGIENLSLIPGTVGGAIVQNIGAYGAEIKNVVDWVEVYNTKTGEIENLIPDECNFGYRQSIFKQKEFRHLIVLRVGLSLAHDSKLQLGYPDVEKYFEETKQKPSVRTVRDAVVYIRKNKLPNPKYVGTAGSFFKNPIISKERYTALQKLYFGIPGYEVSETEVKVPLAWIIDHVCNMKGFRTGDVGTHQTQPLAIVNFGNANAKTIAAFADMIATHVYEKTGIIVEREVEYVTDFTKK